MLQWFKALGTIEKVYLELLRVIKNKGYFLIRIIEISDEIKILKKLIAKLNTSGNEISLRRLFLSVQHDAAVLQINKAANKQGNNGSSSPVENQRVSMSNRIYNEVSRYAAWTLTGETEMRGLILTSNTGMNLIVLPEKRLQGEIKSLFELYTGLKE